LNREDAGRRSREKLRPDGPKIIVTAFAGWLVGVLPYLAFASRRSGLGVLPALVFAALAVIVVVASLKRDLTEATERPALGEWLLGACARTTEGVVTSVVALLFYGLGYGGAQLWNLLVVDLLGLHAAAQPERIAVWTSAALAVLLGLVFASIAVEGLTQALYPVTAGTRSVYYPLLRQRFKLLAFAAGIAGSIVLVLIAPGNWWTTIGAVIILVYVAMPLDQLEQSSRSRAPVLTENVVRTLESAGYAIVRSPRTGDPTIDPLIQNVTLLASAGEDGFAIEVTDREPAAQVEWSAASAVRTAAAVLQQQHMTIGGRPLQSVQPVLIIAGGMVSAGLQRFTDTEGVRLVHLQPAAGVDESAQVLRASGIPIPARVGVEVHA